MSSVSVLQNAMIHYWRVILSGNICSNCMNCPANWCKKWDNCNNKIIQWSKLKWLLNE